VRGFLALIRTFWQPFQIPWEFSAPTHGVSYADFNRR
jgi:hypothetical protein